jgi:hypothetical protein
MNLKVLSYEFGELVYRTVRPTGNIFINQTLNADRRKEHGALGKASK